MSFSKFYKNFILCGDADHHCLLCDETFQKIDDIEKHIRWEKHRQVIKTQTCIPKFKNDGIYKVNTFYYCQHCNQTYKNIATVKEHITTDQHSSNKSAPKDPERVQATYDSGVIIIKNIKIDNNHWHSILSKKCYVCNTAVDNVWQHTNTQDHIIKLIQTKTRYEGNDQCYRKVNNDTFQCFTCKKTFPANTFDTHWQNSDHVKPIPKPKPTNGHTEGPRRIYDRREYDKITNEKEFSIEKLAHIKDDMFFQVDLVNKDIICKKCNTGVKNTKDNLLHHLINKHSPYRIKSSTMLSYIYDEIDKEVMLIFEEDHGKARHELSLYGKENHIKLNCRGSKGYCTLCDRFLSAHINIFKQHVGGAVHTSFLEMKSQIKPRKHKKGPKSETLTRYLDQIGWIPELDDIVINTRLCINKNSFFLMKLIEHGSHFKKTKCFACDETLVAGTDKKHRESKIHKSKVLAARVIDMPGGNHQIQGINNFIREIRPKIYHCGLCNIVLPFWETLEKHTNDMTHKMKIVEKNLAGAISQFAKHYGFLPTGVEIDLCSNSDLLYDNILLEVFSDDE